MEHSISRSARAAAACLSLLLAVAPHVAPAQPATWRAEAAAGVTDEQATPLLQLSRRFGAGGPLAIDVASARAPAAQVLQRLVAGQTQVALVPLDALAAQVPEFAAFDALFVFRGLEDVDRYQSAQGGRGALAALEQRGMQALAWVHGGMLQLLSRQPLAGVPALRGIRVATAGGEPITRQFAALGSTAVRLPGAEGVMGLQRGAVEASEAGWPELRRAATRESGLWVLESNQRYRGFLMLANRAAVGRLAPAARDRLFAEAGAAANARNAAVREADADSRRAVLAQGRSTGSLGREDYEVLTGRLRTSGWPQGRAEQAAIERALGSAQGARSRASRPAEAPVAKAEAPAPMPPRAALPPPPAVGLPRAPAAAAPAPPPPPPAPPPAAAMPAPPPAPPAMAAPALPAPAAPIAARPAPAPAPAAPVAAAPPAAASPEPVVYNAKLAPQLRRAPAAPQRPVVRAGQALTLHFDLGPARADSILGPVLAAPVIVNATQDVSLTVVLACGFCEPGAESLKRVVYRPAARRSDEARFRFTPRRDPERPSYVGTLQLMIVNDVTGTEHDRLPVDIMVTEQDLPPLAPATAAPGVAVVAASAAPTTTATWKPDVVLHVNEKSNGRLTFEVQPVSDEVRGAIGRRSHDGDGNRRSFSSGVNDTRLVDAATKSAYGAMSAVSLQNELLKRLRATGSDASVSAGALATLKLEPADARNVNGVLGEIGRDLYLQLFVDALADRELLAIVQDLERLATARPLDRPLRMKIVTARVSLPWQYLHPVGPDIDPAKFWGLRFSLSVARGDSHTTSNVPQGSAHKMVFARYGSTADPTVALAQRQMAQLKGMPMDLLEVKSGPALLDTLKAERSQITAIMAFLHASSGLMTAGPLDEPELLFNEGDVVTGLKLRGLRSLLPPDEAGSLYLKAAPLVILNACETGTSTTLPRVSLENALFSLGARGIVMTEVSVWINLGHEVATRLIERLGRGEAVSDALTGVRRDLYAQKNNPLGLLYLYSGDPAATLRP